MIKKLPLLLLLGAANQAVAQLGATSLNGPGIGISADYLPASHYIRPEDSVKTSSTTSQRRYNFGAAFMLASRIDTATGKMRSWSMGVTGSYTTLDNKDYTKTIFPKELLETTIALKYMRSMRNRWSMMAIAAASLGTDMEEITSKDIFLQGGVIFIKQHNRHFAYGLGGVLTNAFGTPMIMPAFFCQWKTDGKFSIDVNFPEKISVSTNLNKYTDLALAIRMRGSAYDVTNSPNDKRLMGYSEITAGLENTWHLGKHADFVIAGGSTLAAGVTFSDKKLSDIFSEKPNHRLATNYYLSTGLRWNFTARK
ncbi:hypothetical protein CLV59_10855 [Chitinophaga dinghuensis]|uniref:DUF6268 domain-containing protein n=1 Tax=Chitinophaga dinghuensis TaxID=1539050 RepID=A0A327VQ22_9BACT|nr:DUF6268 family outer membrane beta-barrel protein [Chitinophaga dinghuensis]RAJ76536.1 hypothetical protein CLV59_10855 [Chitinophaga dinghuensis]